MLGQGAGTNAVLKLPLVGLPWNFLGEILAMGHPIELREIEVHPIAEMTEVGEEIGQDCFGRGARLP